MSNQFYVCTEETNYDFGLGTVVTIPVDEVPNVIRELKRCLFAAERATPISDACVHVLNDLILELEKNA